MKLNKNTTKWTSPIGGFAVFSDEFFPSSTALNRKTNLENR